MWTTCCIVQLWWKFLQSELHFSLTSHWQIECRTTQDFLVGSPRSVCTLEKEVWCSWKVWGETLPFAMFLFTASPDQILLFFVRTIRLFQKKSGYREIKLCFLLSLWGRAMPHVRLWCTRLPVELPCNRFITFARFHLVIKPLFLIPICQ